MKDKFYLGLLYGAALPMLAYVFGGMIRNATGFPRDEFFFYILCIGVNVIIFRIAISRQYDQLSRGILFSTFIFAFIFFLYFFKQH